MTRLIGIAKGLVALVLLAALVVGIPWALWHFIGWPLPHSVPSWSALGHDLGQHGIPDRTLVDALTVGVWLTWAVLVVSLAAELPAAIAGRRARRLPFVGAFQPFVGHLLAAVLVAALSFAPRPSVASAASLGGSRPVAAFVLADATTRVPTVTASGHAPPEARNAIGGARSSSSSAPLKAAERTYIVQRGDTLWSIAERECGDPLRWQAVYRLNAGRSQPDGRTLTDPHWIYPGWTLVLPAAPVAVPVAAPSAPASSRAPLVTPTTLANPPANANAHRGKDAATHAPGASSTPASRESSSASLDPAAHAMPPTTSQSSTKGEPDRVAASASLPAPVVPIGFGLLGAGLLAVLVRLRRVQQRHRRYGRRIPLPTGELAAVEQALVPSSDPDAPWFVDHALRLLRQLHHGKESVPVVLGAMLRPDSLELMLEAESIAPAPFTNTTADHWLLDRGDEGVRIALEAASNVLAALPCLVTIGADKDGVVLLNLEAGATIALEGDADVASELATAIALELASAPWNEVLELVDIGVGTEQVSRDRCTTAASVDEALSVLRTHLQLTRADRVGSSTKDGAPESDEAWSRCALISARPLSSTEQEDLDIALDSAGRTGIAVVAPGELPRARWHLVAASDGRLEIPPLGRTVEAQRVSTTHLAGIGALLGLAARRDDVASDAPPYDRIASSGTIATPRVEVAPMFSVDDVTPAAPDEEPSVALLERTIETSGPRTVEVGVLGALALSGLAASPERSKAAELIAWLVFHDRRGTTDEFATALWPMGASEGSHHNVIWDARRALGEDDQGAPMLVRDGDLYLSSLVSSDWARFRELAASDDVDTRAAALSLVRGKPFGDVDWTWATGEGLAASMEADVCDLASALGEQALLDGQASLAARAAEQGILASPYDERLYRLLMRAHDAAGNPAGIRSAMERLAAVLEVEVEPLESVHPETRALYEALMRRQRLAPSVTTVTPGRRNGWRSRATRALREPRKEQATVTELDERRRHSDQHS